MSSQIDFFPDLIPTLSSTFAKVVSGKGGRFPGVYTKEQCRNGAIKRAGVKRFEVLQQIDRVLPAYAMWCEENERRFTFAGFFREQFPGRNGKAMHRLYGEYIKGRLEAVFHGACDAVNRFKALCQAIRRAAKNRPLRSLVRDWCNIGRALSSNPFKTSLAAVARWRDDLRIWEQLEIFPACPV